MDIIRVNTPRGLELKGAMFGNNNMESVVIIMSGICSNLFQNDLLLASGELLSKNNTACIIGHAMDAFLVFHIPTLQQENKKLQVFLMTISVLFMKMWKAMLNTQMNRGSKT